MSDLNVVSMVGRIGKDPEIREMPGGDKVTSIAIANSSWKKVGDSFEQETSWFDVSLFGRTAERVVEKCKAGTLVAVTGSLKVRKWKDQDENTKERVSIQGRQIQFLDKYKKSEKFNGAEPEKSGVPF